VNQLEKVKPEVKVMRFGLEETGCPLLIKNTIEHICEQGRRRQGEILN
jgi:hypothetical protein